jgi:hypothetical protein
MRALVLIALVLALLPTSATAGTWQAGPLSSGDTTYAGAVDQPAVGASLPADQPLVVSGWIVDQTAEGWAGIDDVLLYEGLTSSGGTFLARASVGEVRPDVASALGNGFWARSGFSGTVPAGQLAQGPHLLTIYVHTPSKGWWYSQVPITVTGSVNAAAASAAPPINNIVAPAGSEKISRKLDTYTIRGFAFDPLATTSTGIDRVQVYMDEPRFQGGMFVGEAQFGGSTPSVAAQFGPHFAEAGYRIDIRPTDFTAGNHHLYIYARSSVTAQESLAIASFEFFNP